MSIKRVLTEDGKDITEAVQVLYDIAHTSMNFVTAPTPSRPTRLAVTDDA